MPSVKVNGDLEGALSVFKAQCIKEGVIAKYKQSLAFMPGHERRTNGEYRKRKKMREQK